MENEELYPVPVETAAKIDRLTRMERYKMRRSADIPNIKDAIGETLTPIAEMLNEYTDGDGEVHKVLVIKSADGRYFRTEVAAFIDNYRDYITEFGDEAERPNILITGKKSKRGNPYINFDIVE